MIGERGSAGIGGVKVIDLFKKIFAHRSRAAVAHGLYTRAVEQARQPAFYLTGGVEDSLDGRFDLIALHLWLVIQRLHRPGEGAAQFARAAAATQERVLAVCFADMDQSLREMGVGDLGVGKRIKDMAEAMFGRAAAYDTAVTEFEVEGDRTALRAALERNVYRGAPPSGAALDWLTAYVIEAFAAVNEQELAALIEGQVTFPALVVPHASARSKESRAGAFLEEGSRS